MSEVNSKFLEAADHYWAVHGVKDRESWQDEFEAWTKDAPGALYRNVDETCPHAEGFFRTKIVPHCAGGWIRKLTAPEGLEEWLEEENAKRVSEGKIPIRLTPACQIRADYGWNVKDGDGTPFKGQPILVTQPPRTAHCRLDQLKPGNGPFWDFSGNGTGPSLRDPRIEGEVSVESVNGDNMLSQYTISWWSDHERPTAEQLEEVGMTMEQWEQGNAEHIRLWHPYDPEIRGTHPHRFLLLPTDEENNMKGVLQHIDKHDDFPYGHPRPGCWGLKDDGTEDPEQPCIGAGKCRRCKDDPVNHHGVEPFEVHKHPWPAKYCMSTKIPREVADWWHIHQPCLFKAIAAVLKEELSKINKWTAEISTVSEREIRDLFTDADPCSEELGPWLEKLRGMMRVRADWQLAIKLLTVFCGNHKSEFTCGLECDDHSYRAHMAKRHISDEWDGECSKYNSAAWETVDRSAPHSHPSEKEEDPDAPNPVERFHAPKKTRGMMKDAPVVFLVAEAAHKAAATAYAIIAEGWNASVISVASVTLWQNCPEFRWMAQQLKGKTVVIVGDNDWISNSLVIAALEGLKMRLLYEERYGIVDVLIAAPPLIGDKKLGVDDFLGTLFNGKLTQLKVRTRFVDNDAIEKSVRDGVRRLQNLIPLPEGVTDLSDLNRDNRDGVKKDAAELTRNKAWIENHPHPWAVGRKRVSTTEKMVALAQVLSNLAGREPLRKKACKFECCGGSKSDPVAVQNHGWEPHATRYGAGAAMPNSLVAPPISTVSSILGSGWQKRAIEKHTGYLVDCGHLALSDIVEVTFKNDRWGNPVVSKTLFYTITNQKCQPKDAVYLDLAEHQVLVPMEPTGEEG